MFDAICCGFQCYLSYGDLETSPVRVKIIYWFSYKWRDGVLDKLDFWSQCVGVAFLF